MLKVTSFKDLKKREKKKLIKNKDQKKIIIELTEGY